jgi:hypothetical protein
VRIVKKRFSVGKTQTHAIALVVEIVVLRTNVVTLHALAILVQLVVEEAVIQLDVDQYMIEKDIRRVV